MHRKAGAVLIVFVVVISSVAAAVYYYDLRARNADPYPGSEAVHHSLKDIWYPPEGGYNIFPLMITAICSGGYQFPVLQLPVRMDIAVYLLDATDNSTDLTWIEPFQGRLIESGSINVTYEPGLYGQYGEGEKTYHQKEYSELWGSLHTKGVEDSAIQNQSEKIGAYTKICTLEFDLHATVSEPYTHCTYILDLKIPFENASLIHGHEINIMIQYTTWWQNLWVGELPMGQPHLAEHNPSYNITLGNGETWGMWDSGTMYMLNGTSSWEWVPEEAPFPPRENSFP
ncbi:MAG: hypothetical protein KGY80_12525 [Candidatus Thorarchaeota archaeon]|nr:hypothetical protein [Candidatus Thorarchaeota archaeon]